MSISRGVNIDIFEPAWYLRGMETLLIDFVLNPEIAQSCLDRMTDIKCKIAGRFASIGIDVIIYGDDVGGERSMLISPETWRTWLKPRLKKAI